MTNVEKSNSRSSKKTMGRVAILVLLIAGGVFLFQYRNKISTRISKVLAASEEDPIPVTKLSKQPFLLTVPSTGEVVGMETTQVSAPNTNWGTLKIAWLIPEGSFVKEGDPVVRFDSTDAKLNLENQQNTVTSNEENTKITTNNQATSDKTLKIDRTDAELSYDYAMTVMPQDESIFSKWDIITAQADAVYAKARIDFLKNKQKTQQRIARSDQQVLSIDRNRAQSEISVIQRTLDSMELRAPIGGLIIYRRARENRNKDPQIGDEYQAGQVVVEIVNLDVLQARIYVLERDGGNLAKGQTVVIKLDAIPEKEFHGILSTVSSVAGAQEPSSPLRYFTCDVSISDAGRDLKRIRPGMNLQGDVVLQNYEACFVVPSSAVNFREKERDTLVYLKAGGTFVPKTVKTGLSAHGEAIILDGIADGDLIALRNPFETRKLTLPDFSKGTQGRGMPGRGDMMMMRGGDMGGFPGGMGGFQGGGGMGGFQGGGGMGGFQGGGGGGRR
jgi:multidrug efflux pump subunit AcrA (membrane-fusion protein)